MITKADFPYSLKNVPIPSKASYIKSVIASTETFLQNLRWKAFHLLKTKNKQNKEKINTYGFKTPRNAQSVPQLEAFEADMNHLISNLEFKDHKSKFQNELSKDINKINKSNNLFIKADKTSNVYEVDTTTYKKLLHDNVTANYKKTVKETQTKINKDAKLLTEQLNISDRVEIPPCKEAYITLKDHKPSFPANVKCRLINPAKSNIGIISKNILDEINNDLKEKLQLKQLKNTDEAIHWFKNIKNKKDSLLLICDIVDFYPSINEDLFLKTIQFAEKHTTITELQKSILINARQSLLHFDDAIWTKHSGAFDVTMGAFDGAQVSDLVGLYILSIIKDELPQLDFALYRDDGIAQHKKLKPQAIDKIRKKLHKIFNDLGLTITVETTLNRVNFLDVTMNLHQNSYEPFRKPNNTPLYINIESNHPPHVKKNIPIAVNKRLTMLSSSQKLFDTHKEEYQVALKKSGYTHDMTYGNHDARNKTMQNSNETTERSQITVENSTATAPDPRPLPHLTPHPMTYRN